MRYSLLVVIYFQMEVIKPLVSWRKSTTHALTEASRVTKFSLWAEDKASGKSYTGEGSLSVCLSVLWLFRDENLQPVPFNPVSVAVEVGLCPFWLQGGHPSWCPLNYNVFSFHCPKDIQFILVFFKKKTIRSVTIFLLIEVTYHSVHFAPPLTSYYADSATLKSCDIWKGVKLEVFQNPSLRIMALFLLFRSVTKDTEALDLPCLMTRNNLPTPASLQWFPLPSHFFFFY